MALPDVVPALSLHMAISHSHQSMLDYVLRRPVDVNAADCNGNTPLHLAGIAAESGHEYLKLVTTLLQHGADPSKTNSDGQTPIEVTLYGKLPANLSTGRYKYCEALVQLITAGAPVNFRVPGPLKGPLGGPSVPAVVGQQQSMLLQPDAMQREEVFAVTEDATEEMVQPTFLAWVVHEMQDIHLVRAILASYLLHHEDCLSAALVEALRYTRSAEVSTTLLVACSHLRLDAACVQHLVHLGISSLSVQLLRESVGRLDGNGNVNGIGNVHGNGNVNGNGNVKTHIQCMLRALLPPDCAAVLKRIILARDIDLLEWFVQHAPRDLIIVAATLPGQQRAWLKTVSGQDRRMKSSLCPATSSVAELAVDVWLVVAAQLSWPDLRVESPNQACRELSKPLRAIANRSLVLCSNSMLHMQVESPNQACRELYKPLRAIELIRDAGGAFREDIFDMCMQRLVPVHPMGMHSRHRGPTAANQECYRSMFLAASGLRSWRSSDHKTHPGPFKAATQTLLLSVASIAHSQAAFPHIPTNAEVPEIPTIESHMEVRFGEESDDEPMQLATHRLAPLQQHDTIMGPLEGPYEGPVGALECGMGSRTASCASDLTQLSTGDFTENGRVIDACDRATHCTQSAAAVAAAELASNRMLPVLPHDIVLRIVSCMACDPSAWMHTATSSRSNGASATRASHMRRMSVPMYFYSN